MIQRQPQPRDDKSLGELFGELTQEIMTLVRQEMNLAKTEMSHKFAAVGAQVGLLFAGGALAYAGVLAIVAALVMLLIRAGLQNWLAALIVGVVVAGIGGFMAMRAINNVKNEDLAPRQTIDSLRQLKEDIQ